jgi:hypothetical protein
VGVVTVIGVTGAMVRPGFPMPPITLIPIIAGVIPCRVLGSPSHGFHDRLVGQVGMSFEVGAFRQGPDDRVVPS